MRKCKLEQCQLCKKTFSANDGSLKDKICHSCKEKRAKEAEKKVMLANSMKNKKKKKARKVVGHKLEKIADLV